jgi:hypothetical protein
LRLHSSDQSNKARQSAGVCFGRTSYACGKRRAIMAKTLLTKAAGLPKRKPSVPDI